VKVGDIVRTIDLGEKEPVLALLLETKSYGDGTMIKVLYITSDVAGETVVEWRDQFEVWSEAEAQDR